MKNQMHLAHSLTAATFLLIGTLAIAQTTPRTKTASAPISQSRGIAVDHAGGNGVRRADTGKSGDNPLFEGSGRMDVKPGVRTGNSRTSTHATESTQRKHLAGVKYEDRTASPSAGNHSGGKNGQGLAVNEQGSSTAPLRGAKKHQH
jgi:hypothetical protein